MASHGLSHVGLKEVAEMSVTDRTDVDVDRARQIWDEYQKQHDVSDRRGQAAGIDPVSGRIWFGESAIDIVEQMDAEDAFTPFYCVRVGFDYYLRKGGHR
jgi:hypothetical protein